MANVQNDLQDFAEFVHQRLQQAESIRVSLGELMDEWQVLHPSDVQYAENVAAVKAAIVDFRNGDRGQPAGKLTQELRASLRDSAG